MKNGFKAGGLVLLGALLMAGCGGAEPEPTSAPASTENASPQEPAADDSQLPGAERAEPGTVGAANACCFAKCSDQKWHGPLKNVTYGNCANYSKYWCANHDLKYVSAKWDDC